MTIRVQITLRPAESKKLIAKALSQYKPVKQALENGLLVVHPSSTALFLREYLAGRPPEDEVWMAGAIVPRGACIEDRFLEILVEENFEELRNPGLFRHSWIFKRGRLVQEEVRLEDILAEMGEGDVYIKGVNAFDAKGYAGVLIGSLAGGTVGLTLKAQKRNGFGIVFTAGLEKFIPGSVKEASQEGGRARISDALGLPCGLLPIETTVFTEISALEVLFGVDAVPFAAGGVGGAEGSIMLVIKGEEPDVFRAMKLIKNEIKGAELPEVKLTRCEECNFPGCYFSGPKIET